MILGMTQSAKYFILSKYRIVPKLAKLNFRTLLEPALDAKSKAPEGAYIWHSTVVYILNKIIILLCGKETI
jgi:hypothetical protein